MHKPFFCLLPLLAGLIGCSQPAPMAPTPPKVSVVQPKMMTFTNWDEYPGHLEAVELVEIRPRAAGYLDAIRFQDGAEVKAGDLLFEIDPRPYQAELAHALAVRQQAISEKQRFEAEYQRAQSRLDLARNDLKRAESLRGTKAISEEELDSRSKAVREAEAGLAAAKAAITSAEASHAAAQAAETNAQINLGYARIQAPISGRIGRRMVTIGNLVQTGNSATMLATIVTMDPIYCYFDVEERLFQQYRAQVIKAGNLKDGVLPCALALTGESGFPHAGRVDFFDNQVNPKTGTIRLRAVFPNEDRALMPGMFATVRVPAGPPVQALVVPAVSIQSDQGNKFVLIVNKDGVVEPRGVQIDRQHGDLRVVTQGLTEQDRVIFNGLMMARPGSKVVVADDAAPQAAPAQARK